MSNILFINPCYEGSTSDFSCGLLSIGSYLETKGYKINLLFSSENLEDIDLYLDEKTIYIGISAMTVQIPEALKVIKYVKEKNKKVKIVFGGYHSTLFPEQTIKHEMVDFAIVGDAEETCLELTKALEGKKEIKDIKGLVWKKDGKIIFNEKRDFTNNLELPRMNYSLIHDYKPIKRVAESGNKVNTGVVYSAKGCPFACTFCINSAMKKNWQSRKLEYIMDEIEYLVKEKNVTNIYLVDENFFTKKERFFQFLDEIEKRELKFEWTPQCRAGYIKDNYLSIDVLKRMKKLGCKCVLLGIESGSQEMLNRMKKGLLVSQVFTAVEGLKEAGIIPKLTFMIGMPGEEKEDMLKTFKLIYEISKIVPDFHLIGPCIFRPYPGSLMYERIVELGYKPPKRLEDWEFTDSSWNDRYLLEKSSWIKEKELVMDIKDTLYAYVKFRNEKRFKLARFFLKRVYNQEKLMDFLLKNVPKLDLSAKSIFRPDLREVYSRLIRQTKSLKL
jgi:anaerobic magnesium-protoporphyrin IX monomethyl ester cyclase